MELTSYTRVLRARATQLINVWALSIRFGMTSNYQSHHALRLYGLNWPKTKATLCLKHGRRKRRKTIMTAQLHQFPKRHKTVTSAQSRKYPKWQKSVLTSQSRERLKRRRTFIELQAQWREYLGTYTIVQKYNKLLLYARFRVSPRWR